MLKKIRFAKASEVLAHFDPSDADIVAPLADLPPSDCMAKLLAAGLFADYVQFVAHALPPREGICWAHACLRDDPAKKTPRQAAILEDVRFWVAEPQEARRRTLMAHAADIGTDTPLGWLCTAVAWNGSGSIMPIGTPEVFPQPYLHAKALLGAVGLLAAAEGVDIAALLRAVDARARDVASGGWPYVV